MTIKKVRLHNWKSHLDSELVFSRGVNGLIGIMGSGKSSVMEAISFALFGTFPSHKARSIGLDDLLMKKPEKKRQGFVELEFQVNNDSYYVKRVLELGRGTTHAEIRRDGELVDAGPKGVTRVVEGALQMDYELFSKAVYSEQNSIDYFLRIPKGKRMQHIDRMLKVDRFEAARAGAVALRNTLAGRTEETMKIIQDMEKENLPEKAGQLETELMELNEKSGKLDSKREKVSMERVELSDILTALESREERINSIKGKLEGLKSAIEEIKLRIKEIRNELGEKGKREIAAKLNDVKTGIEGIKAEIRALDSDMENSTGKMGSVNTEIRLLADSIKELEAVEAKCPVCESEITGRKKQELIAKRKVKIEELRGQANRIAQRIEKLKEKKQHLEEQLEKKLESRTELEKMMELLEEIDKLRKRKEEYTYSMEGLEKQLQKLESRFEKTKIRELREQLQEKIALESEIKQELSDIRERISDKQEILEDLKNRMERLEKYRKQVEKSELISAMLKGFEKVLKVTKDQLRQEFLKTVNSIMNTIWPELYPYGDFEGIRLAVDESSDYSLQLREPGGWVSVEGIASGGERSMACLALRIAFSLAFIPNLKWLILDEPTHNLDSNAIKQFAETLRERINQFAEQVFLITHEEKISEGITGNLYKLERNKELNEPTKIIQV